MNRYYCCVAATESSSELAKMQLNIIQINTIGLFEGFFSTRVFYLKGGFRLSLFPLLAKTVVFFRSVVDGALEY